MTGNHTFAAGPIEDLGAVEIDGLEAESFLQRITANDVSTLAKPAWQWNCVLSPQGRVLFLFRLQRTSDAGFLLLLSRAQCPSLAALLERYRLRAKVSVGLDDRVWIGGAGETPGPHGSALASTDGRWLIAADAIVVRENDVAAADSPEAAHNWLAADVASGVPWLRASGLDTQTPQALSLDRLAAYSVRKGCYPGQEIVSRLHFLGQSKRSLRRFASAASVDPGAELALDGGDGRVVGSVVACARNAGSVELLAVCQNLGDAAELHLRGVANSPLQPLALEPPPLPVDPFLRGSA